MLRKTTTPFTSIDRGPSQLAQIIVAASGVIFVLVGLALLLAPLWFFENIGNFPPFNRHYMGDLGAFLLPLGAALIYAARSPERNRLVIAIAAAASVLHVLNHAYDNYVMGASPEHWAAYFVPLLIGALLLLVALGKTGKR